MGDFNAMINETGHVYRHHFFGHEFAQIAPLSSFAGNSRQAIFKKLGSNDEAEKPKYQ